jgi:uncharacterized membrane protein
MPYLHHVIIHFPVALSLVGALTVLIAWLRGDAFWTDAQRRLTYATALAAIVAITTGLLSADHLLEDGAVPRAVVLFHRNVALAGTALIVLSALVALEGRRRDSVGAARASQIGALLAAAVIGGAGHLGGDMLHPGMAPWSDRPHSHGVAAPHGHGGAEPDGDHDHDEDGGGPHAGMPGMPGMMMPGLDSGVRDGEASTTSPDASLDAAGPGARDVTGGSPSTAHTHGPGGADAPRPAQARTAVPPPTATAAPPPTATAPAPTPAMTEMPPGHKM